MMLKHEISALELCYSNRVYLIYIPIHTKHQIFHIKSTRLNKNKNLKTTKMNIVKMMLKWYAKPLIGRQHTMSTTNKKLHTFRTLGLIRIKFCTIVVIYSDQCWVEIKKCGDLGN